MTTTEQIKDICELMKKIYGEKHINVNLASRYLFNPKDREKVVLILKEIQDLSRELKKVGDMQISTIYEKNDFNSRNQINSLNLFEIESKKFQNYLLLLENVLKNINEHMIKHKLDESYIYTGNNFSRNNIIEGNEIDENELFELITKKMKLLSFWMFEKIGNKEDPVGIIAGDETSSLYQVYFKVKSLSEINTFDDLENANEKLENAIRSMKFQTEIYSGKQGQNKAIFDFCNSTLTSLLEIDNEINKLSKQKAYLSFINRVISSFYNKNQDAYTLDIYKVKESEIQKFLSRILISPEQRYLLQSFIKSPLLAKDNFCGVKINSLKNFNFKEEIKVVDSNKLRNLIDSLRGYLGSYGRTIRDIPDLIAKTLYVLYGKDETAKKNLTMDLDNLLGEIFDVIWIQEHFLINKANLLLGLNKLSESLRYPISNVQRDRREVLFYSFVKDCLINLSNKFDSSSEISNLMIEEKNKKSIAKSLEEQEQEKKFAMDRLNLIIRNKKKELNYLMLTIESNIKENARGKKDIPYSIKNTNSGVALKNLSTNQNVIEKNTQVNFDSKTTYESKITQTFFGKGDIQAEIQEALRQAAKINENKKY